jgi:hypothetical protein
METIAKQMIDFQKTTFTNAFSAIVTVQDQAEKLTNDVISQVPWMTDSNKQMYSGIIDNFKKSRETYKSTILDGFEKLESMIS